MQYTLEDMKIILREAEIPFFTDEVLKFHVAENDGDYKKAIYQCLLIKAEDTSLSLSGMNLPDTSKYFRRLAARYRPNNSGILSGG